jgi:hypothetical protein
MAAEQKNFQHFLYVDDNGDHWTKRGELDAIRNAVDGSAGQDASPLWVERPSMRVRKAIYLDGSTGRTKTIIVYTAGAYAALAIGDTLNFKVEGNTGAVTYTLDRKVPEHQGRRGTITGKADHA